MTEDRKIIVLDRVWRTMQLCGGVLSGIVNLEEVNMLNAGVFVTLEELQVLEHEGLVEHPYPNVTEGWRVSTAGRRYPQPSTSP